MASYDPTDPDVLEAPWAAYDTLRAQCPVHLSEALEHPLYSLARHDDVRALLSDAELWSNRYGPGISYSEQNAGSLQRFDPPDHGPRRRFARDPFLPRAVEANSAAIAMVATSIIDELQAGGSAELHDDFAAPLPITSFCTLLGIDNANHDDLKRWAEELTLGMTFPERATKSWDELHAFTMAEVDRRRSVVAGANLPAGVDPVGHVVPDGLFSHLCCHEIDGELMRAEEVTGMISMMLVAGHETTASLITNCVWRLLEDPSQWRDLCQRPELIPNAIEESLRFDPPVLGICRTNTEPVELHGVDIAADAKVIYLMGAANRDAEIFDRPDEFVIDRPIVDARRHLAFGWGIHFCLGAHLARLTARVALETLVARLPSLALAGPTERLDAPFLWGRRRLPVTWEQPS
jgi:cytochrome P450